MGMLTGLLIALGARETVGSDAFGCLTYGGCVAQSDSTFSSIAHEPRGLFELLVFFCRSRAACLRCVYTLVLLSI
jgi:hypothetical protein